MMNDGAVDDRVYDDDNDDDADDNADDDFDTNELLVKHLKSQVLLSDKTNAFYCFDVLHFTNISFPSI